MKTDGVEVGMCSVKPLKVRITLAGPEMQSIIRWCHFYTWVTEGADAVDVFQVKNGRLVRVASFNDVLALEEEGA